MKKQILLILLIAISTLSYAQILNIDKNEVSEKPKTWLVNANLALSSDQQKYNVLDVSYVGDVSYRHKKRRYVFYSKYDRITNGTLNIQDAGFLQVRDRIGIRKKYSMDYFVQYQWNGLWGMVDRQLAGANFIQQWVNNDSVDFFTGIGVFFEHEHWNYTAVPNDKIPPNPHDIIVEHPRLNLTAKYSRTFKSKFDLVVRAYNQSTIYQDQLIMRTSLAFQLNLPISKVFSFSTSAEGIYDTHPIVPIHQFLLSFSQTIGITLN